MYNVMYIHVVMMVVMGNGVMMLAINRRNQPSIGEARDGLYCSAQRAWERSSQCSVVLRWGVGGAPHSLRWLGLSWPDWVEWREKGIHTVESLQNIVLSSARDICLQAPHSY